MDQDTQRKWRQRRARSLLRPKKTFSPSFLNKNTPISSQPLKKKRPADLMRLLMSMDKSFSPRKQKVSQPGSARVKSARKEGKEEGEKPAMGIGFGDLGPLEHKPCRRIPISMIRYSQIQARKTSQDCLNSLLEIQSSQYTLERINSVLQSHPQVRTSARSLKYKQMMSSRLTPVKFYRNSSRNDSLKSSDSEGGDRTRIESVVLENVEKGVEQVGRPQSGRRRIVLEKRWINKRPNTAGYPEMQKTPIQKHFSEAKIANRLFQNDSLQQLVPEPAPT